MPSGKRTFQHLNFIKNHISKKQNVLKMFLIAVFCLMGFVMADDVAAASKFTINPANHAIQKDGTDIFMLGMFRACNEFTDNLPGVQSCSQSLGALSNFDYNINSFAFSSSDSPEYWKTTVPIHESHNYWYDTQIKDYNSGGMSTWRTRPNFFGYYVDEVDFYPDKFDNARKKYLAIKELDPNHLVLSANSADLTSMSYVSDAPSFTSFWHKQNQPYPTSEFMFVTEHELWFAGIKNSCSGCTSLNSFPGKSIGIMYMSIASDYKESSTNDWIPETEQELRLENYWAITAELKHISYWNYKSEQWNADNPYYENRYLHGSQSRTAMYNAMAGEIKSIESIIVLPTLNYAWGGTVVGVRDNGVTFTPNPTKISQGNTYYSFSYSLKKSGNTYYLFVANKNSNTINNVQINIAGLSGSMTAKVLGTSTLSYDAAGRTVPVTNGVFTDNFQGFAGRVYQIYSGSTPPSPLFSPTPAAATPTPTPPYVTPTIYCLGSCPTGVPTPTRGISTTPVQPFIGTPSPSKTTVSPTVDPCITNTVSADAQNNTDRRTKNRNNPRGFMQRFLAWLIDLINFLLRLLGQNPIPAPVTPTPTPIPATPLPSQPITTPVPTNGNITPVPTGNNPTPAPTLSQCLTPTPVISVFPTLIPSQPTSAPTSSPSPAPTTPVNVSNIKWAGARSSRYGITPFPSITGWTNAITAMSGYFPGSTSVALWLPGEIEFNGSNSGQGFNFPNPGGTWNSTIKFTSSDQNESYLAYFDTRNIKVFLQVEPGFSPMDQLFDIMYRKYGQHPSVIGFGVDAEWYQSSCDGCTNAKITNSLAQTWESKIKALNPNYLLFLKHFDKSNLPPTYRGNIIFIDDSEQNGSYNGFLSEMKSFADFFYPNPIMYQIGYPSDKSWWQNQQNPVPQTIGKALSAQTKSGQNAGVVWVDFSLKDVLPVN